MISVYHNLIDNEVNIRKQEIFERYNRLIQWGRKHPTRFIERVFKIELLDYQKWIILNTWTAEKAVWVCSRNAGKTFMGAIYLMTRALLFPKLEIKIMNVSGKQSFETFAKMENIAKKNIPSLTKKVTLVNYTTVLKLKQLLVSQQRSLVNVPM